MKPKPYIARETLDGLAPESVSVSSASNGRARNGTFAKGNQASRGRGGELREWRAAFCESFCGDKLRRVVDSMFRAAIDGNVHAARLLLDHALGRPRERVDLDMTLNGHALDPSGDPADDSFE